MKRTQLAPFLGIVLGMGVAIASCTPPAQSEGMHSGDMPHGTMPESDDHMAHPNPHKMLAIPAEQPVPTLTLTVTPDAMRGWNLQAAVTAFEFAPERVNQTSLTTEGHAHLYIDGEKVTRLYGPWYYIPDLPAGEHEVRVELNANGHEVLTHNGKPIDARVKVVVPAAS